VTISTSVDDANPNGNSPEYLNPIEKAEQHSFNFAVMKLLCLLFLAVIGHGSSLQSTFSDHRYTKLTELNVGKCPMDETQLKSLINQKLGGNSV
jgi:hypothetical protein